MKSAHNYYSGFSKQLNVHIGRRLQERRKTLGLSLQAVGEALDVSFQQIQKYEAGTVRISPPAMVILADFLNVNILYFFQDMPEMPALRRCILHKPELSAERRYS